MKKKFYEMSEEELWEDVAEIIKDESDDKRIREYFGLDDGYNTKAEDTKEIAKDRATWEDHHIDNICSLKADFAELARLAGKKV